MPLVYACICPHGGEIVPALAGRKRSLFAPTTSAMRTLSAKMKAAEPDTIVVATPHNLRLKKHLGVVTASFSSGSVAEGRKSISIKAVCDVEFARKVVEAAEVQGLPVVDANYGALEGSLSNLAMDWGTLIPLWFLLRGAGLKSKVVIVTPSRGIPLVKNFEFGATIAKAADREKKRVALVASADQAHAHKKNGPYGFDRRASEYDKMVVGAVRQNRLKSLLSMKQDFVEGAKPDSLWQLAILAGAISEVPMKGQLLSYQVPTYYGMLCGSYEPSA